jgi:hypothetical protein
MNSNPRINVFFLSNSPYQQVIGVPKSGQTHTSVTFQWHGYVPNGLKLQIFNFWRTL